MKLTKKQLSATHAVTVALLRDIDGVANPGNSRLDRCPMASPEGKVEFTAHVSFSKTSGDKAMESMAGLEKEPGVEITALEL